MRIRIDRGSLLHIPVMRDGIVTMVAICGLRAVKEYRLAWSVRVDDMCPECNRIADKKKAPDPVKGGGEEH